MAQRSRKSAPKIIVAGDVTIDLLDVDRKQRISRGKSVSAPLNWELYPGLMQIDEFGGALMLERYVRKATSDKSITVSKIDRGSGTEDKYDFIVWRMVLKPQPVERGAKEKTVLRIDQSFGYTSYSKNTTYFLTPMDDHEKPEVVVISDAGNGIRYSRNKRAWPKAIISSDESKEDISIIVKISPPLDKKNPLLTHLMKHFEQNLVVILNISDLREIGGNISRGLSWERTAEDFDREIKNSPELRVFKRCRNLIARIGLDAAIYYRFEGSENEHSNKVNKTQETTIYYDPSAVEGSYQLRRPGKMYGYGTVFTAAVARHVAIHGLRKGISSGIKFGLVCVRRYLHYGFEWDPKNPENYSAIRYPEDKIFNRRKGLDSDNKFEFAVATLKPSGKKSGAEAASSRSHHSVWLSWRILDWHAENENSRVDLARKIVEEGMKPEAKGIPVGEFGKLRTIDRLEIESYRSIRNLLVEFLSDQDFRKPISIAVFGPPGSGKSFGVTQVAESLSSGFSEVQIQTKGLTYNLSQYTSPAELINVFHAVRDFSLEGKIPLVFFDEFDSDFEGRLGWLKYFLSPMQDGSFREGEVLHPIGKAIFVFAGGTSSTFQEFYRDENMSNGRQVGGDLVSELLARPGGPYQVRERRRSFKDAKGPDFVSRLRGYVNIMGPNPVDQSDKFFELRRAVLLRSILGERARGIFHGERPSIDPGVLNALLRVSRYKHGARSIMAIMDMSRLANRKRFERAALPPADQIDLHVDAQEFVDLLREC